MDAESSSAHWLSELDEDECWRRLAAQAIGRVAWSNAGRTAIVPVNYRVAEGRIVLRTSAYSELARGVDGAQVAFEVDEVDVGRRTGWSVVVIGTASFDEHGLAADDPDPWPSGQRTLRIVVTPHELTGREVS